MPAGKIDPTVRRNSTTAPAKIGMGGQAPLGLVRLDDRRARPPRLGLLPFQLIEVGKYALYQEGAVKLTRYKGNIMAPLLFAFMSYFNISI